MIYPLCDWPGVVEMEIFSHDIVNHDSLENALARAKELLINDTDTLVLILYSAVFSYNVFLVNSLNNFADSISNPVVLCTNPNFNPAPDLCFQISSGRYFEFESKTVWEQFGKNSIKFHDVKTKKYLFASQKDLPVRKFILANLVNNGHLLNGYVGYNRKVVSEYSFELANNNEVITNYNQSIDHLFPLPDLESTGEWVNMPEHIRTDSYLNIVTDTFYHLEPNTLFLSEKIFNAMAFGQFFVYLGPAGSLQYLKEQGYETFDECIDQSYDNISDPYYRLTAFTASMLDFVSQPLEDIALMYKKNMSKLIHNRHKLFNSDFKARLFQDLQTAQILKNK